MVSSWRGKLEVSRQRTSGADCATAGEATAPAAAARPTPLRKPRRFRSGVVVLGVVIGRLPDFLVWLLPIKCLYAQIESRGGKGLAKSARPWACAILDRNKCGTFEIFRVFGDSAAKAARRWLTRTEIRSLRILALKAFLLRGVQ